LVIRVNDIEWKEAPSFYGTSPKDKIYTVSIADDSTVTICFGDGITGSRLPTGTANVKATYRTGIGMDGLLDATQLSMLATPQLGINKVNNPLATSGAQDPETIDSARQNAPLTVLTLDRIVSITDFENFTRAFAGISKARADIIWAGEQETINISVALADGTMIDPSNKLYSNLLNALKDYGHTKNPVKIAGYKLTGFTIDAAIAINDTFLFEDVKLQVLNALYARFSFDVMNFGQDVTPAQIITTMQNVEGVVYVQLNQLGDQNPFATENDRLPSAIPKLGSDGKSIELAELLVIDLNNSTISQIP
jgi:predicted phage baseplate assembly protein